MNNDLKEQYKRYLAQAAKITKAYKKLYNPPGIDLKAVNKDPPAPSANKSTAEGTEPPIISLAPVWRALAYAWVGTVVGVFVGIALPAAFLGW